MNSRPTIPTQPRTNCPYCHSPLESQRQYCPSCGVDLALAAFLAESALLESRLGQGMPVSPEVLVPRLGEYLIARGMLTDLDLQAALAYQKEQGEAGRTLLVGQALLELGLIDKEKLDQAVTEQILELQAALRKANRRLEQRVRERTEELERALARLSELNQLKSNFISNISHELRTPLTHIKGYLELFSDGSLGQISEDQAFALDVMMRSSIRLEQLVADLLHFSMASQGEFTLRRSALSLSPLLNLAAAQLSEKAEAKLIKLHRDIPPNLPKVPGDEEKITWVVTQLLDNAIKFTDPMGEVHLSAVAQDQNISVRVSDTGIGIPPARINEIFEPFHQLDGTTTRRQGGTGLGLALVLRILEAHGALPRIDSRVGEGTTIEFTLRSDAGLRRTRQPAEAASPAGPAS